MFRHSAASDWLLDSYKIKATGWARGAKLFKDILDDFTLKPKTRNSTQTLTPAAFSVALSDFEDIKL